MGMLYQVENQWGGSSAPWHQGGKWVMGRRPNQDLAKVDVKSDDGGETLAGAIQYAGEGPIDFKGQLKGGNNYDTQVRWGGSSAPWREAGYMLLGFREGQHVVAIDVNWDDNDHDKMSGSMTYKGEGPIGFQAQLVGGGIYGAQVHWGGKSNPDWHNDGLYCLGSRQDQNVVALDVSSKDDGKTLTGSTTYAGEGPIDFRSTKVGENSYAVEVHWGGGSNPDWHDGGIWVIGGRTDQNIVKVDVNSKDGGATLQGAVTYAGEGPIDFKGELQNG